MAQRREERPPRKKRFGFGRKKKCYFCITRGATIDYKDVSVLRQQVTNRGMIKPRRKTGTCARHQRRLATAIKRARHVALMPYAADHSRG